MYLDGCQWQQKKLHLQANLHIRKSYVKHFFGQSPLQTTIIKFTEIDLAIAFEFILVESKVNRATKLRLSLQNVKWEHMKIEVEICWKTKSINNDYEVNHLLNN